MILHSDRAVPGGGERVERNEGMGIVLEPSLADSCRQGGEQWKPVMQHSGSKQWHCIDYVIMRQTQMWMCCDVSVLRSAYSWTDHKLLRGQLKVHFPIMKPRITIRRRFDVGALKEDKVREMYCEKVCNSVTRSWDSGMSGLEKRERVRYGLVGAAESVIGYESRRQPGWFKDNASVLKEFFECRSMLFGR